VVAEEMRVESACVEQRVAGRWAARLLRHGASAVAMATDPETPRRAHLTPRPSRAGRLQGSTSAASTWRV
jgi:hypothetical protein